jgi:hypothetical protein
VGTDREPGHQLSAVHVNRTLQTLRGRDLISFSKGVLTIHNWNQLAALADFRSDYLHLQSTERPETG